jgi:hypothetical protein
MLTSAESRALMRVAALALVNCQFTIFTTNPEKVNRCRAQFRTSPLSKYPLIDSQSDGKPNHLDMPTSGE